MIKTAIIGAGYIADWHADAIKALPGVSLVAVCDRASGAAKALADAHGAQSFTDMQDMLRTAMPDAVHILTPPDSHATIAQDCLKAGVHCLIEKPVALSAQDTQVIATAARDAGRQAAAGHNFMGMPSYDHLKEQIKAGALGRISGAEINWHFPLAPLRSGPFGLWLMRDTRNLLLELGPHLFGFAVDLFGPVTVEHVSLGKSVDIPGSTSRPQSWRIVARAGEADVTINLSLVETVDDRSVVVRGSGGRARFDFANDTLVLDRENASDIILNPLRRQMSLAAQHFGAGLGNAARQIASLNRKSPYALSFAGTADAFYAAIRKGETVDPRFHIESAVKVMDGIDQALSFVMQDAPIKIPRGKPKPTALVIGGTGFIGRALVRELVARGQHVRVLSRGRNGPFDDIANRVEMFSASLHDEASLQDAMQGIKVVYHLGKSMDTTWEACLKNDVGVTERLGRLALDAGVNRFVYTGTIASYDMSRPDRVITETTEFGDMTERNLYARSKAECEARLRVMHKTEGLPLVIARPGIVVGAGGPLQHWGIGRWHGAGAVRIWGKGNHNLPFVLLDDVVDGLIRMSENDFAIGESFNLVGAPTTSARDYFSAIHTALGAKINVSSGNLTLFWLSGEVKYALKKYVLRRQGIERVSLKDWQSRAHFAQFDNAHPRKLLGWVPETDRAAFVEKAITNAGLMGF